MKAIHTIVLIFGTMVILAIGGCNPNPAQQGDTTGEDSVTVEIPSDVLNSPAVAVTAPELLGSWLLVSLETTDGLIAMESTDTLEFTPEGMLITAGRSSRSTVRFYQKEEILESEIWPAPVVIRELNKQDLVLIDTVDGIQILYHYKHL